MEIGVSEGSEVTADAEEGRPVAAALQQSWGRKRGMGGGPKEEYTNKMDCVILGSMLAATAAGALVGSSFNSEGKEASASSTPLWVLSLLSSSYLLLIPSLIATLFDFQVQVALGGNVLDVLGGVQNEAFWPLTKLLFETGSRTGGCLLVLYAAVIPGIKLVLLLVGELWRNSPNPDRVRKARMSIKVVQFISKWACPDMFAYILLLYLFRDLDERSPLIQLPAHLDLGFTCFSLFCVGSTLAALALRLPGEAEDVVSDRKPSWALRFLGQEGIFPVVAALGLAFAGLLAVGMAMPSLGLRLDENLLIEPRGPLPAAVKPILERLEISKQVNADVSLWACMKALLGWLHHGELNCIFAFTMLAVFMVGLTIIDMAVLVSTAALLHAEAHGGSLQKGPSCWERSRRMASVAHVTKHASMLDVAVMGVVVVALAGAAYRTQGFVLKLMPGIWVLLAAEVIHYATYYIVVPAVESKAPESFPPSSGPSASMEAS